MFPTFLDVQTAYDCGMSWGYDAIARGTLRESLQKIDALYGRLGFVRAIYETPRLWRVHSTCKEYFGAANIHNPGKKAAKLSELSDKIIDDIEWFEQDWPAGISE